MLEIEELDQGKQLVEKVEKLLAQHKPESQEQVQKAWYACEHLYPPLSVIVSVIGKALSHFR